MKDIVPGDVIHGNTLVLKKDDWWVGSEFWYKVLILSFNGETEWIAHHPHDTIKAFSITDKLCQTS